MALREWVEELKGIVNGADVAASYRSRVETEIDPATPYDQWPDSWTVADMVEATHDDVLAAIASDVDEHLRELRPMKSVYEHGGTPLLTTVERHPGWVFVLCWW
jgi:hypothetical protein